MEYTVRIVIDVPDGTTPQDAARKATHEVSAQVRANSHLSFEVTDANGNTVSFDQA